MKDLKGYTVFSSGEGNGFIMPDGSIGMIKCFSCGLLQWAIAVYSGVCRYCNHDANTDYPQDRQCE